MLKNENLQKHVRIKIQGSGLTFCICYPMRPLKNLAIFIILKKTMDFFEVTGGRVLKRPAREPRNWKTAHRL